MRPSTVAPDFRYQREQMVRKLAETRGVDDDRVLQAMSQVPRHLFVKGNLRAHAYTDNALPIGDEQTISQPYVVARMTAMLDVGPEHSVLEIGTGSGYQTAVLALMARRVYSLERMPSLAREAIERIRDLRLENVKIQTFDGTVGWSDVGPFDRIMVTAGAPEAPQPLLDQLASQGRLLVPEGERGRQRLILYRQTSHGVRRTEGEPVAFVPLVGRYGWPDQPKS